MGFMDIIGTVANVATSLGTIFGGPAGAAATVAGTAVQQLTGTTPVASVSATQASANVQTALAQQAAATQAGAVVPSGASMVRTQTVVQRINRATGAIISEVVKKGTPWLMRSEVNALKKVAKAIKLADRKLPRSNGKTSVQSIDKAVAERITQNMLINAMHHGHHNGNGS